MVFYCIWDRQSGFLCRRNTVCMDRLEIWKGEKYLAFATCVCRGIAAGNRLLFRCCMVSGIWHGIVPVPLYGSGGWETDGSDRRIPGDKEWFLCSGAGIFHRRGLEFMETETLWSGGRTVLLSAQLCSKHMGERRNPALRCVRAD